MSFVDEVLLTQMSRTKLILLKVLIKMPLVQIELGKRDPITEEEKIKTNKVNEKFREFVKSKKESGMSRHEIIEFIQDEFLKYGLEFRIAPQIVYRLWDELNG